MKSRRYIIIAFTIVIGGLLYFFNCHEYMFLCLGIISFSYTTMLLKDINKTKAKKPTKDENTTITLFILQTVFLIMVMALQLLEMIGKMEVQTMIIYQQVVFVLMYAVLMNTQYKLKQRQANDTKVVEKI